MAFLQLGETSSEGEGPWEGIIVIGIAKCLQGSILLLAFLVFPLDMPINTIDNVQII